MSRKTEVSIKVNGQVVQGTSAGVYAVSVSTAVNKLARAKLVLRDGSVARQDFAESNREEYAPGSKIEILLGSVDDKKMVFSGVIVKHGIKIRKDRSSTLELECRDAAFVMALDRKSRSFKEVSDADLVSQIADEYSEVTLEVKQKREAFLHPQILQYQATDWDFTLLRAEANGLYVYNTNGKVILAEPDLSQKAVRILEYGRLSDNDRHSILWEFESCLDGRYQREEVEISSWSTSDQAMINQLDSFQPGSEAGNISAGDLAEEVGSASYRLQHLGDVSANELAAYADAVKQKSVLGKIVARAKIEGTAEVQVGELVELRGVGERFNGKMYISRVQHTFQRGRWFTELLLGLNREWFYQQPDITTPPALGMVAPVQGLQLGKVIALEKDGEPGNARVKVSIPGIHAGDEDGIWARMATPHTGTSSGGGAMFFPELDDEVIMAYVSQDARFPVILGSLYSENKNPPFELKDDNFIKGITTAKGSKLIFDDEHGNVTIETAKGNTLIFSDQDGKVELKDQSGNVLEMSSSGISLTSDGSIKLNAKGNVEVKSLSGQAIIDGVQVKLGLGTTPAAGLADPTPAGGPVGPCKNVKVLI